MVNVTELACGHGLFIGGTLNVIATGAPAVAGDGCAVIVKGGAVPDKVSVPPLTVATPVLATVGVIERFADTAVADSLKLMLLLVPSLMVRTLPSAKLAITPEPKLRTTLIVTWRGVHVVGVRTLKSFRSEPAGTLNEAGIVTLVLSLDRLSVSPLFGARPLRTIVPIDPLPPETEAGFSNS